MNTKALSDKGRNKIIGANKLRKSLRDVSNAASNRAIGLSDQAFGITHGTLLSSDRIARYNRSEDHASSQGEHISQQIEHERDIERNQDAARSRGTESSLEGIQRFKEAAIAHREAAKVHGLLGTYTYDTSSKKLRREFNPQWATSDAVALSHHILKTGDHSVMPILGDALRDAGVDHADILDTADNQKTGHGRWLPELILAYHQHNKDSAKPETETKPEAKEAKSIRTVKSDDMRGFHAKFHAEPNNHLVHRVYADYLRDRDKPFTAEIVEHRAGKHPGKATITEKYDSGEYAEDLGDEAEKHVLDPGEFKATATSSTGYGSEPIHTIELTQRSRSQPDRQFWWIKSYPDAASHAEAAEGLKSEGVKFPHEKVQ